MKRSLPLAKQRSDALGQRGDRRLWRVRFRYAGPRNGVGGRGEGEKERGRVAFAIGSAPSAEPYNWARTLRVLYNVTYGLIELHGYAGGLGGANEPHEP